MGLMTGTSGVITVKAFLTNAGKRKLFTSMVGTEANLPFITKFSLGDSDTNYAAVEAGYGALTAGYVPEPSDFRPKIRSFLLQSGSYRPGKPWIFLNGEFIGSQKTEQMSIGANLASSLSWTITTQWPKNSAYAESYLVTLDYPDDIMTVDQFNSLFTMSIDAANKLTFTFNGNASASDLALLIGENPNNTYATIGVKIEGMDTHRMILVYVQLTE